MATTNPMGGGEMPTRGMSANPQEGEIAAESPHEREKLAAYLRQRQGEMTETGLRFAGEMPTTLGMNTGPQASNMPETGPAGQGDMSMGRMNAPPQGGNMAATDMLADYSQKRQSEMDETGPAGASEMPTRAMNAPE